MRGNPGASNGTSGRGGQRLCAYRGINLEASRPTPASWMRKSRVIVADRRGGGAHDCSVPPSCPLLPTGRCRSSRNLAAANCSSSAHNIWLHLPPSLPFYHSSAGVIRSTQAVLFTIHPLLRPSTPSRVWCLVSGGQAGAVLGAEQNGEGLGPLEERMVLGAEQDGEGRGPTALPMAPV